MPKFTNVSSIPLSAAVWLASSHYDFSEKPAKTLSATELNKSIRQYVLGKRMDAHGSGSSSDISGLLKSKMGSAIHNGIEHAWKDEEGRNNALKALGVPTRIIDRIVVNPSSVSDGDIPIYLEVRGEVVVDGWTISGMFDSVFNGVLEDFKSTGTYKYGTDSDWQYIRQGSIYRLIHSDKITADHFDIIWLFTDWKAGNAIKDKSYPPNPIMLHRLKLMTPEETVRMIGEYIRDIERHWNTPEAELPLCEDHHLWRGKPSYKVYKDHSAKRAMNGGTFENMWQASAFVAQKGGIIKTIPTEARACSYCNAREVCSQYAAMKARGEAK